MTYSKVLEETKRNGIWVSEFCQILKYRKSIEEISGFSNKKVLLMSIGVTLPLCNSLATPQNTRCNAGLPAVQHPCEINKSQEVSHTDAVKATRIHLTSHASGDDRLI